MNSLNSIILEGNLTEDSETRISNADDLPMCTFTIASTEYENDKKEISHFDIVVKGKTVEKCKKLKKGRGIRVVGRLKQARWNAGDPQFKVFIIAEHVELQPIFLKFK